MTAKRVMDAVGEKIEGAMAQAQEQMQAAAAATSGQGNMDVVRMGIEQAPPEQRHLVIQAYRNAGMPIPPEYDDQD